MDPRMPQKRTLNSAALWRMESARIMAPSALAAEFKTKPVTKRPPLSASRCILVVDDEPMALTLGQKILSQAGYTVVVAQSGFDAFDLFRENPRRFDLVLLDLTMPFMDGEDRGGVDLVKRFAERFKSTIPS